MDISLSAEDLAKRDLGAMHGAHSAVKVQLPKKFSSRIAFGKSPHIMVLAFI
jgi:hypothetical protein